MNSLSDILSQKADELFPPDAPPASLPEASPAAPAQPVAQTEALKTMLYSIKGQIDAMLRLLDGVPTPTKEALPVSGDILPGGERVVEGAFTGESMIGDDGKHYNVPPNYASKSKLVAGDRMKLTITKSGSFIYKQIGPVERERSVGILACDNATRIWSAVCDDGERYKLLTASVTFYKGKGGDEVILLRPKGKKTFWAAVDTIIAR